VTEQPDGDTDPAPDEEPVTAPAAVARTGVPSADAAGDRLGELEQAPLDEHVEIYEDVHRRLQEGLADLDEQ
jgi:hypothetical protein